MIEINEFIRHFSRFTRKKKLNLATLQFYKQTIYFFHKCLSITWLRIMRINFSLTSRRILAAGRCFESLHLSAVKNCNILSSFIRSLTSHQSNLTVISSISFPPLYSCLISSFYFRILQKRNVVEEWNTFWSLEVSSVALEKGWLPARLAPFSSTVGSM